MKNALKKLLLKFLFAAFLAASLVGCTSARERQREIAAQTEIVEVDDRGYVRYRGEIITPGEFNMRIRGLGTEVEGKPVLLSVNPEVYRKQPAIVPYLRRVLARAKTGTVYDKIPDAL